MPSGLPSLLLRLAGRADKRPAEGVVVGASVMLFVTAGWAVIGHYLLANPDVALFIDRDNLREAYWIQTRILVLGWAVLVAAGMLAWKRWPEGRLLAHGAVQFYIVQLVYNSFLVGHYTNLFGAMGLVGGALVGLLVFEARIVRAGVVTFVVLLVATTAVERMGIVPYAPLFAQAPLEASRASTGELMLVGGLNFAILLVVIFAFIAGTQLLRDRELRLRRATTLIRRYVASQVAERILSGEHGEEVRPERRKLTIFFSDVVGFTQSADQMEPEDLAALLNEYLSEMASIADSYGATLNQFVGDGIMSFFGAPDATDDRDHALRAVRMALDMQRRMAELEAKWFAGGIQTPFRIRIGINTGVASVGDYGSEGRTTYSAIGNQTNLAARIQDHCDPGSVLISHTTWGLVNDEIRCKERGEIEFKGLHYPVRVYEVIEDASREPGAT